MNTKTLTFLIALCTLAIGSSAHANVHSLSAGQVFIGEEQINEQPTGAICYVTVQSITPIEGWTHCADASWTFLGTRSDLPKDSLVTRSHITNYHRPEYPAVKSCAANVNGTTYGPEIYGTDTTAIYIQFFSGTRTESGVQYDYFLTLSPSTKKPTRARIHELSTFKETDTDCVNLTEM